jgi:hypothetical protein
MQSQASYDAFIRDIPVTRVLVRAGVPAAIEVSIEGQSETAAKQPGSPSTDIAFRPVVRQHDGEYGAFTLGAGHADGPAMGLDEPAADR